ncbi:hypothetical protein [Lacticaseibacillus mingshuiensis]|uniref:hypothetical protein n=1 Tax=Lacticaseibacillus mingshuiensis TaxID=2799574 RepID=UPI00194F04F2|nr:hypothetical protein [Lacticaseibacillus mingshuiensis]
MPHRQQVSAVAKEARALRPVVRAALEKLDQWADWPLNEAERDSLWRLAMSESILTHAQWRTATRLLGRVENTFTLAARLWRKLRPYRNSASYPEDVAMLCIPVIYQALFQHKKAEAQTYLSRLGNVRIVNLTDNIQQQFLTHMIQSLPDADTVYQATTPMIEGLRLLERNGFADALVDNRRHILQVYGRHSVWLPAELGALARTHALRPAAIRPSEDERAWMAEISGLAAALHDQPLASFQNQF